MWRMQEIAKKKHHRINIALVNQNMLHRKKYLRDKIVLWNGDKITEIIITIWSEFICFH